MTKLKCLALVASTASLLAASVGSADDAVRIGLIAPLTGSWSSEGQAMRNGVQLLAEEQNARGGLLGKPVEILVEDDGSDPRIASSAAQRLVARGAVAVIGSYASSVTEATQSVFDEASIPQVAVGSTAVRLTEKGLPHFFRICPRDDEQGRVAAATLEAMKAKRVAVLHDNSTYSKGLADQIGTILAEKRKEPVFFDALTPRERNYAPVLRRLMASRPDVVFFTGYYPEAGLLLRQKRRMGWATPFVGGDAVNNPDLVKVAGKSAAAGFLYLSPPVPRDLGAPEARAFVRRYEKRFREPLGSTYGVLAGDAFGVLASAIEATRTTSADAISKALKSGMAFRGFTGAISFDAKGDRVGDLFRVYRIRKDGGSVLYEAGGATRRHAP
ncbi:MAG: branched chain amino acid ABC transporter substrate-binding protein [Anaeromyxobacter sp. RBG_16_69_14]|nr:MAG: branched chain amino acid ABC transporter substrate-binding protein [Anaeromyxobacter sp. RBG_16_69_14]